MAFNPEHIHWYWLAAGVALIALETLAPGAVLIWFGIAAIVTGIICTVSEIDINSQFLIFSVLAIFMTVAFKIWQKKHPASVPIDASGSRLNRAGSQYIGQEFTLVTDIENGHGRLKVADTSWRCSGPDLPSGSRVRVVAVESGTLRVEPIQ